MIHGTGESVSGNNFASKSTCESMKTRFIQRFVSAVMLALAAHPMAAVAEPIGDDVTVSRQNAITKAVSACSEAIVGVSVTEIREHVYRNPYSYDDPIFERFFGPREYRERYKVQGVGSGFIISADGLVLTNDHVAGNASKVVITMTDGKKYDAKIIGSDPVADVALLKIESDHKFPFVKLASSSDVIVGEWVIAFGNPFGLFDNNAKPTVTVGVVSNMGVNFTQEDGENNERVYKGMIQTDAAISSGNSGGPLVNAAGEVIGVNTVIYSTSQSSRGAGSIGIGFAIPIDRVKRIVDKLEKYGSIDRDFWTGMNLQLIDEELAQYFRLKRTDGILVTRTAGDGPADRAGIEPGDVIVSIDGVTVTRTEDVNVAILDGEVGQKVKLTIERNGEMRDIVMTLEKARRAGGVRH